MPQYQVYFDTLEGEKKYDVDIGDDERLEEVIRDVLGELSEKGHMMRGLSTGDLKVVWGGAEGKELDLSRTLPEQNVRPNDVLRVLVESYEGGARSLRADRIEKEWELLRRLASLNPGRLEIIGRTPSPLEEVFRVRLLGSPGLETARGTDLRIRDAHTLVFRYTRFYPEVPVECYVEEGLFHPNVKPETRFMCLWQEAMPRDNIVQAVARAQAVAAWRMLNLSGPHLMNKAAGEWYRQTGQPRRLVPLSWDELCVFELRDGRFSWIEPGRPLAKAPASRLR